MYMMLYNILYDTLHDMLYDILYNVIYKYIISYIPLQGIRFPHRGYYIAASNHFTIDDVAGVLCTVCEVLCITNLKPANKISKFNQRHIGNLVKT